MKSKNEKQIEKHFVEVHKTFANRTSIHVFAYGKRGVQGFVTLKNNLNLIFLFQLQVSKNFKFKKVLSLWQTF